jgi:hypothetical protein
MSGDRMSCAEALALAKKWAARGIHSFPVAISLDDRKQSTNKRPLTGEGGFRNGTTDPVERSWPFQSFSA